MWKAPTKALYLVETIFTILPLPVLLHHQKFPGQFRCWTRSSEKMKLLYWSWLARKRRSLKLQKGLIPRSKIH